MLRRLVMVVTALVVGLTLGAGGVSADHIPRSKADCMNGGFQEYGFKNQGQCIKFVNGAGAKTYTAQLTQLNASGARGAATVTVNSGFVTVTIEATGLSPNLPHAQHFHIGGMNTCPPPSADQNGDGFIDSVEGQPSYGPVRVSLTTSGDTSAASGLAVDRFPVADANGNLSYSRTFQLPAGVSEADVARSVIVQHGISELFADPTAYDGEPRSSLDPALPLETTIPADCGALQR